MARRALLESLGARLRKRIKVACNLCGSTSSRAIRTDNGYRIRRCAECGLIYVNPQPDLRIDEDVHYLPDASDGMSPGHAEGNDQLINAALADVTRIVGDHGRLLDVGCGYGLFLAAAQRQGWECFGIDVSEAGVRYATDQMGLSNIRRGHLLSASYTPASFEVITMFNLLEHVSDPKALLTETFRLLRPNGVLLTRVPNMAFHDLLWKMPGITHVGKRKGLHYLGGLAPPQHLFGFAPRTLSAILESVGYSSPQIRPAVPHNAERKARKAVTYGTEALHRLTMEKLLLSPTIVAYARKPEFS
jgi:SAM-dependent methyltransferase